MMMHINVVFAVISLFVGVFFTQVSDLDFEVEFIA